MKEKASKDVSFWINQIEIYDREFATWEKRSKAIVKRYKDDRVENDKSTRFNILWSNVETLGPALYASPPKPNVDRRFQDDDDLGRVSAQVIERAVSYYVHNDAFDDIMQQSVKDRLLPGRGTSWVRYVPNFKGIPVEGNEDVEREGSQVTDDAESAEISAGEELIGEDVETDYVHWRDFGHTWGRTWQEVRAVWRKVYLSRAELVKRFGDKGAKVPLNAKQLGDDGQQANDSKKGCVYEIWDKSSRKAYWVSKDMPECLDDRDDPLGLMNFFPCPKPLYATLCNDNLVPTPDYIEYQDQALELDSLTSRIEKITDAIKVAGVYDKSAEGVQRLLEENTQNKLLPVDNWAIFGEKGGLKGVVDFFPVAEIAQVLITLYDARDRVKNDLYEITGISDVIRGATNPNETASAQQLKGQYASLRLNDKQKDVARYARDLVRIMAEIICEHFSMQTIKKVSGVKLLTNEEKQQIQAQMQSAQQAQPPQQPPIPEEVLELMDQPSWEEVEAVIRDDAARSFRIDIETDSTIKTDQEADKQSRIELLGAVSGFMQQAVTLPLTLMPLAMELLQFGVRGFKAGRDIETAFKTAQAQMQKAAEQPQQPPEDPAVLQAKLDAEEKEKQRQFEAPLRQKELQLKEGDLMLKGKEVDLKGSELQLKAHEMQMNAEHNNKKLEADDRKNRMDAKNAASPDVALSDDDMNEGNAPMAMLLAQIAQMNEQTMQGMQQIAMIQQQGNQAIIQAISNPPPRVIVRDKTGKVVGVE